MNELAGVDSREYGIFANKGIPVVSSRKVADVFGKQHDNVLRDIRSLDCSKEFSLLNYEESNYKIRGKRYPEYLMTKDGFTFLVMGYRGKKAAVFKETYIAKFNEMKDFITSRELARMEYPHLTEAIKDLHDPAKHLSLNFSLN